MKRGQNELLIDPIQHLLLIDPQYYVHLIKATNVM